MVRKKSEIYLTFQQRAKWSTVYKVFCHFFPHLCLNRLNICHWQYYFPASLPQKKLKKRTKIKFLACLSVCRRITICICVFALEESISQSLVLLLEQFHFLLES
uniref:Uncharacterized protein n=1 Tax=Rhizophora mucronata TaxID=61149 RepID=A0A2P2LT62_RHIMU